jgi:hypothetical protein
VLICSAYRAVQPPSTEICGTGNLVGGNGAQERDSAAKLLRRRKVDPVTMTTLPFNMEIPFDAREVKPAGNSFAG